MQLLAMTHGVNAGEVHFPPRGHFNMMTKGGNYFSLQIELTILRRCHFHLCRRNINFLISLNPRTLSHGVCVGFLYLKLPYCIDTMDPSGWIHSERGFGRKQGFKSSTI